MYCSDECKETAYKRYHSSECGYESSMPKILNSIPFRILFELLSAFDGDIVEFGAFIAKLQASKHCLLDFDFSDPTSHESIKNRVLAINTLHHRNDPIPYNKLIVEYLDKIFKGNKHEIFWKSHRSFIISLTTKLFRIYAVHKYGVSAWPLKLYGIEAKPSDLPSEATETPVADTFYPLMTCFGHSCAPNVGKMSVDGKSMYSVHRPIKSGQELFDSYIASFVGQPKILRQRELAQYYNINCKCEACVGNYPCFQNMKNPPGKFHRYAMKEYRAKEAIENMQPEEIWQKLHVYYKVIEQNEDKMPSPNIMLIIGCMISALICLNKPEFIFK